MYKILTGLGRGDVLLLFPLAGVARIEITEMRKKMIYPVGSESLKFPTQESCEGLVYSKARLIVI